MSFPLMPVVPSPIIPSFSAALRWSGSIVQNSTLNVTPYITSSFSTLMVVQFYTAPGGGETFYYPPTTKINGVDMPLVTSIYTNAFDDGNGWSVSTQSVSKGASSTLTWTSASTSHGAVYEVQGFTDMLASKYAQSNSVVLSSSNSGAATSTTVNTTSKSKVLYLTLTATAGVDTSGKMDQFNNLSGLEIGFDWNPSTPSSTYTGNSRGTSVISFNTNY